MKIKVKTNIDRVAKKILGSPKKFTPIIENSLTFVIDEGKKNVAKSIVPDGAIKARTGNWRRYIQTPGATIQRRQMRKDGLTYSGKPVFNRLKVVSRSGKLFKMFNDGQGTTTQVRTSGGISEGLFRITEDTGKVAKLEFTSQSGRPRKFMRKGFRKAMLKFKKHLVKNFEKLKI